MEITTERPRLDKRLFKGDSVVSGWSGLGNHTPRPVSKIKLPVNLHELMGPKL